MIASKPAVAHHHDETSGSHPAPMLKPRRAGLLSLSGLQRVVLLLPILLIIWLASLAVIGFTG